MSNNSEKSKVIAKIVKLFFEFLIAALVAWFGASCCRLYFKPISTNYVQTYLLY